MFTFYFCKRKLNGKDSAKAVLELYSSAVEREKREARFLYRLLAVQRINFKQALIAIAATQKLEKPILK